MHTEKLVVRFLCRYILFLVVFSIPLFIELSLLPIDYFTFRLWESITVHKYFELLPGPFYPHIKICTVEEGDLAHHTKYAVKKSVCWETDRWGYRASSEPDEKHHIVVIGDSNVAGSALSQEETFAAVLQQILKKKVYLLSPATIYDFFKAPLFMQEKPDAIIVGSAERFILSLPPYPKDLESFFFQESHPIVSHPIVQGYIVFLDRLDKKIMHNYLRQSFKRMLSDQRLEHNVKDIFFYQGASANNPVPDSEIDRIVELLYTYKIQLAELGIRFIFLPIPNKENIYYKLLPQQPKATFLPKLIHQLQQKSIEVIDTQTPFEHSYHNEHKPLYHTDDTHWNAEGVRITARLCAELLRYQNHEQSKK